MRPRWGLAVLTPLIAVAILSCGESEPATGPAPGPTQPPLVPRWQAFSVADLKAERQRLGVGFFEFLSEASLRMGLYHLDSGAEDGQDAHAEDEVYYVLNGNGTLNIDGRDHSVEPGTAFFVRARIEHRFHSITSDLDVLVVFATRASNQGDPAALRFSQGSMVAPRDSSSNVWNPFLGVSTMSLGMYMLPELVGGDNPLTHTFDEINVVVGGRGRFEMSADVIDIEPGSVVYVENGVAHRFTSLSEDLDVLILWER